MEVTWAPDDWFSSNDFHNIFKRNYIELTLSDNAMRDQTKLEFAALTIDEITSTLDTLRGLKILFNDSAKYESLVRILTICDRYRYLTYIPSGDHILILNRYKSEEQKRGFECGLVLHRNYLADPPVQAITRKYLPVFSLLIVLGVVSIFKATRSLQPRNP
jgi:hypothetical protein